MRIARWRRGNSFAGDGRRFQPMADDAAAAPKIALKGEACELRDTALWLPRLHRAAPDMPRCSLRVMMPISKPLAKFSRAYRQLIEDADTDCRNT